MSVASGPKIATDGLLFGYDMYDPQSYRGAALTNQFLVPTPIANGDVTFALQGTGTFKRIYSGTFDNYSITNNDVVYRYDLTAVGGCYYHGNAVTLSAGQYITFTFDYYISPDAQNYPTVNYLGNVEGAVGGAATDPTPTLKGVWKTATIASGVTTAGNYNLLLYPGACNPSYLASSGFILYRNPQALVTSSSNTTAPFVGPFGSRSSTKALFDVTENNLITISSLTYNSTGTSFSFNGSTDYMDATGTGFTSGMTGYSICYWAKRTTSNRMPVAIRTGTSFYWYGDNSWAYTHGGVFGEYYYPKSVSIPDNTWGFFCCTYDGANVKIYRNGVYEGQQATTGTANWSSGMRIGGWNGGAGYQWSGNIDAVSFYSRALSESEVTQNFNATRGRYGV
jgi:hypothetical protein